MKSRYGKRSSTNTVSRKYRFGRRYRDGVRESFVNDPAVRTLASHGKGAGSEDMGHYDGILTTTGDPHQETRVGGHDWEQSRASEVQ